MKSLRPSRKLIELWDRKLKRSGFVDAETRHDKLKTWTCRGRQARAKVCIEASAEYFRAAGFFLHEYKFESEVERAVWECHAEGLGRRETFDALRKKFTRLTPWKVRQILSRLTREMKRRLHYDEPYLAALDATD